MKKNTNTINNTVVVLIFLLVLVVLFWMMPNLKIITIGDFFEKIVTPLSLPLSIVFACALGLKKIVKVFKKNKGKSP